MSSVEAFSSLLYELIAMNKLSGSRVARVTESATHALHDPDGLSKVMLKAHMRAPPQNKLVSLYLFDAIARHAQDIARRNGTGLQTSESPAKLAANAAAFLHMLQEPAAQVGTDSLHHAPPEQREKVRKVMDIWDRAGTFHPRILQRIREQASAPPSAPTKPAAPPPAPSAAKSPPPPPTSLPPHVLALLGQVQQSGALSAPGDRSSSCYECPITASSFASTISACGGFKSV